MYSKMMSLLFGLVILNCLFFINLKKLSNFINVFDKPDNKLKKHTATVPLLGGTILVINFSLMILFIFSSSIFFFTLLLWFLSCI